MFSHPPNILLNHLSAEFLYGCGMKLRVYCIPKGPKGKD